LLAYGRWFSPGTPASSTTKAGRHNMAESGVKHNTSNQIREFSVGGDKKNKIRRTIQIGISFRLNYDYSSLKFDYH
jgi:hypothetical protein